MDGWFRDSANGVRDLGLWLLGWIGDVRFREEVLFNEKGFGVGFGFCKGRWRWWINVGWWWAGRTGCRRPMNGDGSDGSDIWIYC